jgi:hypothetical protein
MPLLFLGGFLVIKFAGSGHITIEIPAEWVKVLYRVYSVSMK